MSLGSSALLITGRVAPAFLFGAALVLVTWRDASYSFEDSDAPEDYLVQTVGWIVNQGPRFLTVASEKMPDGDGWRAVTHLPLSAVETVENLKVG